MCMCESAHFMKQLWEREERSLLKTSSGCKVIDLMLVLKAVRYHGCRPENVIICSFLEVASKKIFFYLIFTKFVSVELNVDVASMLHFSFVSLSWRPPRSNRLLPPKRSKSSHNRQTKFTLISCFLTRVIYFLYF